MGFHGGTAAGSSAAEIGVRDGVRYSRVGPAEVLLRNPSLTPISKPISDPVSTGFYLYLLSISHTDFCTRRCTIVSSDTPPCCDCDTPSTDVDFAPTSIFSSV